MSTKQNIDEIPYQAAEFQFPLKLTWDDRRQVLYVSDQQNNVWVSHVFGNKSYTEDEFNDACFEIRDAIMDCIQEEIMAYDCVFDYVVSKHINPPKPSADPELGHTEGHDE